MIYRSVVLYHHNEDLDESTSTVVLPETPRPSNRKPIRRSQADIARSAVGRWLLITAIGLLLNAPDIIIRLLALVGLLCEDCIIQWNPSESRLVLSSECFDNHVDKIRISSLLNTVYRVSQESRYTFDCK
jgi:hypothetical protein